MAHNRAPPGLSRRAVNEVDSKCQGGVGIARLGTGIVRMIVALSDHRVSHSLRELGSHGTLVGCVVIG